jgi:hypothetical protein
VPGLAKFEHPAQIVIANFTPGDTNLNSHRMRFWRPTGYIDNNVGNGFASHAFCGSNYRTHGCFGGLHIDNRTRFHTIGYLMPNANHPNPTIRIDACDKAARLRGPNVEGGNQLAARNTHGD